MDQYMEVERNAWREQSAIERKHLVAPVPDAYCTTTDAYPQPGEDADEAAAATRIQAMQRGRQARRQVDQKRADDTAAATKIQAMQRGKQARKQVDEKRAAIKKYAALYYPVCTRCTIPPLTRHRC